MYQLRNAEIEMPAEHRDPWATDSGEGTFDPGRLTKALKTIFSSTPTPTTPIKPPWYKTPIGIAAIVLVGFLGYRHYQKRQA
jgi:hypothetical protein